MSEAKWVIDETDQRKLGAYCPECGRLYTASIFGDAKEALQYAYDQATQCCAPKKCTDCGEIRDSQYWTVCTKCQKEREVKKERERFEKATKVTLDEYYKQRPGNMLYWDEEFYSDIEDLIDENDLNPPEYVWSTSTTRMSFDATDLIENACSDMHEDAYEDISTLAHKRLQKFLDLWCKKHSPTSYFPDYTMAIVLSQEERRLGEDEDEDA